MSMATMAWIWIISLALALGLLAVHLRFTLENATLSALPLLCGGVLGPLLALMLDRAEPLVPTSDALRAGLAPLLIGIAGAASVRIRHLVAGIPAALAIPPGPSNTDLLAAIESHGKGLRQSLGRFAAEQQQQNHATLSAALRDVIDDFHQRINGQFRQHLTALQAFVADTGTLLEKHRTQQMETMHHERRSADQISRSVQEFHALLAQSEGLATSAAQVREALELLGPRQEALAAGVVQLTHDLARANDGVAGLHAQLDEALDEFVLRSRHHLDGVGKRVGQSTSELQQALQRAAEQTRAQISDIAGKHQQQMTAMNKELSEALGKPLAAMGKQLTGMQSKLSTDLAPMAQQIRRAADLSKR
jgi:DNA anti-recombination protein RmuC